MPFGQMKVGTYTVSRRILEPGTATHVETTLRLGQHPDDGGQVVAAIVSFVDAPKPGSVSGPDLVAQLDATEFDLWYRILRTEDPVWLAWSASDDDGRLELIALSSLDEAPGEGLDTSP